MSSEMTTRTGITFYGGVGEMGGNKFLVEDDDTKIFLHTENPELVGKYLQNIARVEIHAKDGKINLQKTMPLLSLKLDSKSQPCYVFRQPLRYFKIDRHVFWRSAIKYCLGLGGSVRQPHCVYCQY